LKPNIFFHQSVNKTEQGVHTHMQERLSQIRQGEQKHVVYICKGNAIALHLRERFHFLHRKRHTLYYATGSISKRCYIQK